MGIAPLIVTVLSLIVILVVSRKNLWGAIFIGAIILVLGGSNPPTVLLTSTKTMLHPNILILALALAEIPLIGKILEKDILQVFNSIDRRKATILGPSIFGLLPIPGGAILSCPIIDNVMEGKGVDEKVACNIWFRHILFIIYPLSPSLIVATTIAGLNILNVIPFYVPIFVVALTIGWIFYLRTLKPQPTNSKIRAHDLIPVMLISLAPLLQISLSIVGLDINIATFVAVSIVLVISVIYVGVPIGRLGTLARKMKIWNFSLILLSLIFYTRVFVMVSAATISRIKFGTVLVLFVFPFVLGLLTGRVQLAASLVLPILLSGDGFVSAGMFIAIFSSALSGYLMSPAHPCLVLSVEYFKSSISGAIKKLLIPSLLLALISLIYGIALDMFLLY